MQKKIMLLLGFIAQLLGFHAFSQEQKITTPLLNKSLLWRISGKNLTKPSYVFGTIHAICKEDYFFTDKMRHAFDECDQLVLEVNLNDPEMDSKMVEKMQLPSGKTLRDYFSDENQYQLFAKDLKKGTDLDIELFSHLKPFVLISALSMNGFACSTTISYETKLLEAGESKKMKIAGLETAESQLHIFDEMSNKDIERLLMESIEKDSSEKGEDIEMVALYKQEDINGLYSLIHQSAEMKGHEDEFLTKRNENWGKLLPNMMNKNTSFVAVGAAHLPGEKGILNILRKQGYKVEAVNN